MKKGFILGAFLFLFAAMMPATASAKTLQTEHKKNNPPYDCSVTKKPDTPKWVWYRYPEPKHPKRDAYGNKKVHLIWEDSDRAHDVQIRIWTKGGKKRTIKTEDDAQTVIKKLKNGKTYSVKVRGVSNCGKSGWSKIAKVRP